MKTKCPHCLLKILEKKAGIKFSEDFGAGFACAVLFYKDLTK